MAERRDPNDTVPLMLRIREDLRQDLEKSAKARRVSLNQECIDRLAYVRDRKGLLTEILSFAFGDDRLVGLLLVLGLAMGGVANGHRRLSRVVDDEGNEVFRRPPDQRPSDWIDDPSTFHQAVQAAMMLLEAARPKGEAVHPSHLGRYRAGQVIAAMGGKAMPALMPALPAKQVDAIKELLGPVAQRMTSALQVRDVMASRIASGEWKPNSAIPNERDLAREFDVSPETMRKALDLMEAERLLARRAGPRPDKAASEDDPTNPGALTQRADEFNVRGAGPAFEVHRDSATGEIWKGRKKPASRVLDQPADVKREARVGRVKAHEPGGRHRT